MNIPALWRSFYPGKSPISYLLREQIPDLWFRIHSLPESKRYAENEDETHEILRRQNLVASKVLGENSPCVLFFCGYDAHKFPALFNRFERRFFYRFRTEELRLTMFAAETRWQSQQFDGILRRVADWEISHVRWMNAQSGEMFAPYDGGADLFLDSTARRNALKFKYKDWLSVRPDGKQSRTLKRLGFRFAINCNLRRYNNMKQFTLTPGSDFSRLQIRETETPRPGPSEVAIRVRAASLNYRDLLTAQNASIENVVPLSDGAGDIIEVGDGVTDWKTGDRVCVNFFRDWQSGRFRRAYHDAALGGSCDGMLSEIVVFPAHSLVRVPDDYSFEEAATLPCAGLTAWCGLRRGGFVAGDSVLLQGTGGVSIWGLQIVVASGGTAIITSSSDDKLQTAREMGALATVNYRATPDWEKEVYKLTDKRGVDHILEVGGPDTLGKSLASLSEGGHIAQIGVLTGFDAPDASLFPLVAKNATMSGIYVGDVASFESFVRFLNATRIKPVVDRVFPFDKARAAYEYMKSGAHMGKVVISI